jgi:hypothetical protein
MYNTRIKMLTVLIIIILSLGSLTTFVNANNEYLLRSEHGVAFEKVGVVDNDMTTWFQTFIIPMTHTDFHNPKYNLKTIWLNKTSQLPSIIDTGDDKLNAIMMDYRSRIIDLMQICEDMQGVLENYPQRVPNCRLCIVTLSCDCLLKTEGYT